MESLHPLAAYRQSQTPPLSQADLARLLGVDRATVLRWESGDRKIGRDKLQLVSDKTGIAKRNLRPDLAAMLEAAE